jgi:hypothetical protein
MGKLGHIPPHRSRRSGEGERDRPTEKEEWRRHLHEQDVLHHVDGEQAMGEGFDRRDEREDERAHPREEGRGPTRRPGGAPAGPDPVDGEEVEPKGEGQWEHDRGLIVPRPYDLSEGDRGGNPEGERPAHG